MATIFYTGFKEQLLTAGINLLTDDIKVVLIIGANYTPSVADVYLSQIPAGGTKGDPQPLLNKTVTGGTFDADDVSFSTVTGPGQITGLLLYKDTGNPATSPLIFADTAPTGFPVTDPVAITINVIWDNGANRIFTL